VPGGRQQAFRVGAAQHTREHGVAETACLFDLAPGTLQSLAALFQHHIRQVHILIFQLS